MFAKIDIEEGLNEAWTNIAEFVPKLFAFLIILLIGYFIVKVIAKVVDALLERTKFDNAVQRGSIGKALARSKFDASDIIAKLIFWALFLLVLQMAFGVFGNNPISDLIKSVIAYIPKVIVAIIIVVIAGAIAAAVKEIIDAALGGLSYGRTLSLVASTAIILVGVFAALDQLEIAPTIVSGLFYALLAIIVGSSIIAIGGGGIAPMRQRWENVMQKYDSEKPALQQQMSTAKDRVAQRAEARKQQVQSALNQPPQTR